MKPSKPVQQNAAQEECGVWLDTVQLKGKAKQKCPTRRPISKLLNPFAGGGGYSVAVALNFTQTKIEMPKTKQSTISSFFKCKPRVLNEKATSDEPNMDPVQSSSYSSSSPSSSVSTEPTSAALGMKRRRESHPEQSDSEPDGDFERETMTKPEPPTWQELSNEYPKSCEKTYCLPEEEQSEELNPPQSKRRFIDSIFRDYSQPPPQAWSQDPLCTFSQYSDSESYPPSQTNTTESSSCDSEANSINILQSLDNFGLEMDLKGKTSTQKSFKPPNSSHWEAEKENTRFLLPMSPQKRKPYLLNTQPTRTKTDSPQKQVTDQAWSKADDEGINLSPFKWAKPSRSSPLKKRKLMHQCTEPDEDSLNMLFTQDSQGFRVIAHRGLHVRSPLKDQGNHTTRAGRSSVCKSWRMEEDEDEMLFTQDSQGNMVIKH